MSGGVLEGGKGERGRQRSGQRRYRLMDGRENEGEGRE